MDFDIEKNIGIFNPLFTKRPEISPESLKQDLKNYYLPYIQKLIAIKQKKTDGKGVIVGVSAIQGAGKTTQGEVLEILLSNLGFSCVSCSIDDHYITHNELLILQKVDPRFIRRGVTHDLPLAIQTLTELQNMKDGTPTLVPAYDKGALKGDGDRFRWIEPMPGLVIRKEVIHNYIFLVSATYNGIAVKLPEHMGSDIPVEQYSPEKGVMPVGWKVIAKKPDFIFYDGWMLGARKVSDESVFNNSSLPALETADAQQFAKDINKKLAEYETLWNMIEFMNVIHVPNYQISLKWRDQAEQVLRQKGQGMSFEAIKEFVYYFWRSVHPAIQIKNLAHDTVHAQQVTIINDDHSIKEMITPAEAVTKYP